MQSQVRFNRVPEKVKVPGILGAKPNQVQRVPEKVLEKVPGSLGAKPSQVPNGFRRRLQRRSQARFYIRSFFFPPCRLWGIYSYGLNGMSGKLTAVLKGCEKEVLNPPPPA